MYVYSRKGGGQIKEHKKKIIKLKISEQHNYKYFSAFNFIHNFKHQRPRRD